MPDLPLSGGEHNAAPAAGLVSSRRSWPGWAAGAALLLLALPAAAALLAYLRTPYAGLRAWYLGLTANLYRADAWSRDFFTPAVYAQGRVLAALALAALAVGVCWALLSIRSWHRRPVFLAETKPPRLLTRADAPWLAGVLLPAAALWAWGATQLPPAYDEVFSAVYSAGSGSGFVAWSYYMLPNNHVLFNVLNGGLLGKLAPGAGLVLTGRALSGLAYAGTLAVVFRLGAGLSGRRWVGAGLAGLVGLQFSLWGFGFQARGYALYALLHWLALATLLAYWRRPVRRWRWLNAAAVAAGYATVPTFLFYHAAQLLAAGATQLRQRRPDAAFWAAQAGALAVAGAFYLPVLLFSGLKSLTGNAYVRPAAGGLPAFAAHAWPDLKSYATYCFGQTGLDPWPAYALTLLPLALLAWPRWRPLGGLYLAWLLTLLAGTLALRHVVFHRNLLALFSFALVLAPLTVGLLLGRWRAGAGWVGAAALSLWLALGFAQHNPVREPFALYYYDLPAAHERARQRLARLPPGAAVAFTEEAFYPYYLHRQAGNAAAHPAQRPAPDAAYYISAPNDSLAAAFRGRYAPADTVGEFTLWRRRAPGGLP